jgi:hypothetical protein
VCISRRAQAPNFYFEERAVSRDAAYRRLAVAIVGLDVATVAYELSAERLASLTDPNSAAPRAA